MFAFAALRDAASNIVGDMVQEVELDEDGNVLEVQDLDVDHDLPENYQDTDLLSPDDQSDELPRINAQFHDYDTISLSSDAHQESPLLTSPGPASPDGNRFSKHFSSLTTSLQRLRELGNTPVKNNAKNEILLAKLQNWQDYDPSEVDIAARELFRSVRMQNEVHVPLNKGMHDLIEEGYATTDATLLDEIDSKLLRGWQDMQNRTAKRADVNVEIEPELIKVSTQTIATPCTDKYSLEQIKLDLAKREANLQVQEDELRSRLTQIDKREAEIRNRESKLISTTAIAANNVQILNDRNMVEQGRMENAKRQQMLDTREAGLQAREASFANKQAQLQEREKRVDDARQAFIASASRALATPIPSEHTSQVLDHLVSMFETRAREISQMEKQLFSREATCKSLEQRLQMNLAEIQARNNALDAEHTTRMHDIENRERAIQSQISQGLTNDTMRQREWTEKIRVLEDELKRAQLALEQEKMHRGTAHVLTELTEELYGKSSFRVQIPMQISEEELSLLQFQNNIIATLQRQIALGSVASSVSPSLVAQNQIHEINPSAATVQCLGTIQEMFAFDDATAIVSHPERMLTLDRLQSVQGTQFDTSGRESFYENMVQQLMSHRSNAPLAPEHGGAMSDSTKCVVNLIRQCAQVLTKNATSLVHLQEAYCKLAQSVVPLLVKEDSSKFHSVTSGIDASTQIAIDAPRPIATTTTNSSQTSATATVENGVQTIAEAVESKSGNEKKQRGGLIEKKLAASVVATCVERNCRHDCLEIVADILEFDEEERHRVGLDAPSGFWGSFFMPDWSRGVAKREKIGENLEKQSFSSLLDDFVRDETG